MITIVTAMARSGTSLTMQMLQAAGYPLMWNRLPNRTAINPYGHYELNRYRWDADYAASILPTCENKAVKIFPTNLQWLTSDHDYRFIYLDRDPVNVRDSQIIMLEKENRLHEKLDAQTHLDNIINRRDWMLNWLRERKHVILQYEDLFTGVAQSDLGAYMRMSPLQVDKMRDCVDSSLHHFKVDKTPSVVIKSRFDSVMLPRGK